MASNGSNQQLLDSLPRSAITNDTARAIGESDSVLGTVPITSEFNDLVTEFVLVHDGAAYALAFDLTDDGPWQVVATRECETDQRSTREVIESETVRGLWVLLQDWRQEHNIDYLAKHGLIPTTRL